MHGYGKIEWADGRRYEGEYENDKKQGQGIFYWADGRKYVGTWKDGQQHGQGDYYQKNGQKKLGEWVEGKRVRWVDKKKKKEEGETPASQNKEDVKADEQV